jgi:DNA ligase-associated metallophosphoesterase
LISEKALISRLNNKQSCIVEFANNRFLLDASGTLFWPDFDLLIFSDLHFEKGSFLSQFANPLPRMDTRKTLDNMQKVLATYQPECVVCLGDSFHDGNAISRMETSNIELLNSMVASVQEWQWVLGNHDAEIPKEITGESFVSLKQNNILLVHEPEDLKKINEEHGGTQTITAQIIGHFHPKMRIKQSGHSMSGKCFVVSNDVLLMPAFGQYTGGLSVDDKVVKNVVAEQSAKFLLFGQKIFNIR